jgi:hypothetical protein
MSEVCPAAARKLALAAKYTRLLKTLKSKEARRKAANRLAKFTRQAKVLSAE